MTLLRLLTRQNSSLTLRAELFQDPEFSSQVSITPSSRHQKSLPALSAHQNGVTEASKAMHQAGAGN